jgi:hypothetical protein
MLPFKASGLPVLLGTLVLTKGLSAQDPVGTLVDRLELEPFKAHIKGLTQFGDRGQLAGITLVPH